MAKVPASEFQREFSRLRRVAHREAVIVTSHGRDDVVLLSAEEYQRLRSLDVWARSGCQSLQHVSRILANRAQQSLCRPMRFAPALLPIT